MDTWNTMTMSDLAIAAHRTRIVKANRTCWMIDEAARSRATAKTRAPRRQRVIRVAGAVAALAGMALAGPWN
jgi:hypothetical protein